MVPVANGPIGFVRYVCCGVSMYTLCKQLEDPLAHHTRPNVAVHIRGSVDIICTKIHAMVTAKPNTTTALEFSPSRSWSGNATLEY